MVNKKCELPCVKFLLMVFNIAFWASGLIIVWCGIWMQTDLKNYFKISTEYSTIAPYVLVTLGTLIIVASMLACNCTLNGQPSLLMIYGGFLITIMFVILTLSAYIYTYKDLIGSGLEQGLQLDIRHYKKTGSHRERQIIDYIQSELHCCGVNDYKDWITLNYKKKVADSCCLDSTKCDLKNPNDFYQVGCYKSLMTFVESNMATIGAAISGIAFLPFFGTILACFLASNSKKSSYQLLA